MTIKIEGYLTLEPCRDLSNAKPGQLAIEGHGGREYSETAVEIAKVYKNGQIVLSGGGKYNFKWKGSKDMRRVNFDGNRYSLRPFNEGETVESFLAAQAASRQAQEEAQLNAAQEKEAEVTRRLAALDWDSVWDNREEATYEEIQKPGHIQIIVLNWRDNAGWLHVTHCYIPDPVKDLDGNRVYELRLWDVDGKGTGASSATGKDVKATLGRWIAAWYVRYS